MIYRAIVKRKARGLFAALSRGRLEAAMKDFADDVHHVFPGDNALGGERHSRAAMEAWFERLYRLIPEIGSRSATSPCNGWPWDTAVAVQWTDRGRPPTAPPYENEGAHWIRLRWGKGSRGPRLPRHREGDHYHRAARCRAGSGGRRRPGRRLGLSA